MKGPPDWGESDGRDGTMQEQKAGAAALAVLDARHLQRQVSGDRRLSRELLQLYAGRLTALAPALRTAPGPERRAAAHALRGASLAVGAFALAHLCDCLENHVEEDAGEAALLIETTQLRVADLLRRSDLP